MNKYNILVLCIFIISLSISLAFIYYLETQSKITSNKIFEKSIIQKKNINKKENIICPSIQNAKTHTYYVSANDETFTPNTLHLPYNTNIKLIFSVNEGYHNLVIKNYNIYSPFVATNKKVSILFTTCQKGIFQLFSDDFRYRDVKINGTLYVQ